MFGRVRYLVTADLITAAVNIVVAVLLIRQFGAVGAAIATTGTLLVQNAALPVGAQDARPGSRRSTPATSGPTPRSSSARSWSWRSPSRCTPPFIAGHRAGRARLAGGLRAQPPLPADRRHLPRARAVQVDAADLRRPVGIVNDDSQRRSRVPPEFESLAYLYQPADAAIESAIVEADERWLVPDLVDDAVDVVLWGRLARNERPSAGLVPIAIRREMAIARLRTRPPGRLSVAALHRLPPVRRPGLIRGPIRAATLGGVLVEMVRRGGVGGDRPTRVIDAVVTAAGSDPSGLRLRPSGDGSALARLTLADGTEAELRVAKAGHTKDPARGYAGLRALESARVPMVPRPLGGGTTAGAAWSPNRS